MKALPIHEGAFTVLLISECKPRESEALAEHLSDFIEKCTRFHPGFLSALVYLTEDAAKIVEVFQWARAEDWEAYRRSEDGQAAVRWLSGRTPSIQFLELVRATRNPPPGSEDEPR